MEKRLLPCSSQRRASGLWGSVAGCSGRPGSFSGPAIDTSGSAGGLFHPSIDTSGGAGQFVSFSSFGAANREIIKIGNLLVKKTLRWAEELFSCRRLHRCQLDLLQAPALPCHLLRMATCLVNSGAVFPVSLELPALPLRKG